MMAMMMMMMMIIVDSRRTVHVLSTGAQLSIYKGLGRNCVESKKVQIGDYVMAQYEGFAEQSQTR